MVFTLDGGTTAVDMTSVHAGDVVVFSDTELNDQGKNFIAPFDFDVTGIRIEYACSGTAGTRLIRYEQRTTGNDVVFSHQSSSTPIANEDFAIEFSPTVETATAPNDSTFVNSGFDKTPRIRIAMGQALIFTVTASHSADDMIIHIRGIAR